MNYRKVNGSWERDLTRWVYAVESAQAALGQGELVYIRNDHLLKVRVSPFLCAVLPISQEGFTPVFALPQAQEK